MTALRGVSRLRFARRMFLARLLLRAALVLFPVIGAHFRLGLAMLAAIQLLIRAMCFRSAHWSFGSAHEVMYSL
jgi:hypothetical protein